MANSTLFNMPENYMQNPGYNPEADWLTNMQNYQTFLQQAGQQFQNEAGEWDEEAQKKMDEAVEQYGFLGGLGQGVGNIFDAANTLGGGMFQNASDTQQWWQGNDPFYTPPEQVTPGTATPDGTGDIATGDSTGIVPVGQEGNTYDVTTPEGAIDETQTDIHDIMTDIMNGEGETTNADGTVNTDGNTQTTEGAYAGETTTTPAGETVLTGSEADDSLQPAEYTAITNTSQMGDSENVTQGNIDTMGQVVDELTQPTELGTGLNDIYNQAVSGELTGPNANYYNAQSEMMDTELDKMMQGIKKEYSTNRGLGGTGFNTALGGALTETAQNKMGLLSDLAKSQTEQASDFYNTQQGQRIDAGQTGVALAQGADETGLGANQTALDYIIGDRNMTNEEANTELNDKALAIKAGEVSLDAALEEMGLTQQFEMFKQQLGWDQEKWDDTMEQWETQMDAQTFAGIVDMITGGTSWLASTIGGAMFGG